ncbi:MAG: universal stress protein [Gammaproteobacteria bacterium]|nr:universal stress protein [Gammaproteobacteria bacterium]
MTNDKKLILACVDGSKLSEAVCDYAVWLAQRIKGPLKLMYTIDHHPETAREVDLSGNLGVDSRDHLLEDITNSEYQRSKLRIRQGKEILNVAKERVFENGFADPIVCLQHGSLIESLVELKDELRILVIGARGKIHENKSDQIGAKLEPLIRSLHGHILVAYEVFTTPKRIMIAYDGSEASEKAIEMIAHSPLYKGLSCHLVRVNEKNTENHRIEDAAERLKNAAWKEIVCADLQGTTEDELCEYQKSQDIDLTIMGAFSHTRLHDFLLGSLTTKMLLNTNTPLLLLR